MEGWIKLHRKICDSDMYRELNSKQRDIMMNILLMANHQPKRWEYKGEIYEANPGQLVTSLEGIRKKCARDVSVQSVRTALLKLEKWGFLTNESTKTGRLITIVNWGVYQGSDDGGNKDSNKEPTKNQQRTNKELTPNKNVKNDKECKEEVVVAPANPFKFFRENGFGMPTPFLQDEMNHWIDGGYFTEPESVIIEAMKEALRANVRRWNYVNSILMNWSKENIKTAKDAQTYIAASQSRNNVVPIKKQGAGHPSSSREKEWAETERQMDTLRAMIKERQRANGG